MSSKVNFKLVALCTILSAMLVVPALGQAKEEEGARYKEQKDQLIKELKLAPEKEKAILAVDDKYARERKEIIAGTKKANDDLQAALASANPDEANLKELVSAITAGQDNLFASFKKQRDEELALMTPAEQAKYLVVMSQWRQKLMEKQTPAARTPHSAPPGKIERTGQAAGEGIERGVDATKRGVQRAGEATARGIEKAGEAIEKTFSGKD